MKAYFLLQRAIAIKHVVRPSPAAAVEPVASSSARHGHHRSERPTRRRLSYQCSVPPSPAPSTHHLSLRSTYIPIISSLHPNHYVVVEQRGYNLAASLCHLLG